MIGRQRLVVLLTAACLPVLAGCPAPGAVTDVDRQRVAVLQREKIVGGATGKANASPGFLISPRLAPRRGKVDGRIVGTAGATPPAPAGATVDAQTKTAARTDTARALATLRNSGWTVYFVGCTPPGDTAPLGTVRPWPYAESDRWLFDAFAYKVIDQVSYFADIQGEATDSGRAQVDFTLLAPNEHETVTNLFPDAPPSVSPVANCVESAVEPTTLTHAGPILAMSDTGPEPGAAAPLAPTGFR
jgi:hypothetical protein